ncbi:unnamed protein product (plasmid) [Mycetohabitans rhizoxinica HKI 454]|uniref:Transposase n=1 Tax=Mycetohabitans rhizoxinica (strain DSM 19002 / CIP 109453 / HKI 454) TaxID=882378 RepID=E5AW92_MYCRK|nr:unnamed protein product [Mycetohabitans rhizoxinica HKI 454]
MMHGREKSDSAVVAKKPANKVGEPAAQWVEPRAGTEGNANQNRTCRAQIVSRDRAGIDAEGITRGAPQAIQVADRWHLLKHLGDAIERALSRCPASGLSAKLHARSIMKTLVSHCQRSNRIGPAWQPHRAQRSNKRSGAKRGSHATNRSCATIKVGWQSARLRASWHWIGVRCGIGSTPVGLRSGRNGHPRSASWIPIA